ncbi:MAG: VWA domain-containing protein [Planctomycetes bacterium]|nr:VWA domain-containing protein [Planctomycetota bacterium]
MPQLPLRPAVSRPPSPRPPTPGTRGVRVGLASLLLVTCLASSLHAQGMIIVDDPPTGAPGAGVARFSTRDHRATVTIRDQVAATHVEQTFVNFGDRETEATFLFPIPVGAALSGFRLKAGGRPVPARILEKEEARRVYESIVARRRDPALLECVGRALVQARVFPIPPRGEQRIEIDYEEVLPADAGLCRYVYPLSLERLSARPLDNVTIVVRVESSGMLKNLYSPSHTVSVSRPDDRHGVVSFEETHTLPDQDFTLYFGAADGPVGLHFLTFADGKEDGYFLLLASPQVKPADAEVAGKDVAFVLDTSGSMAGEKIAQARRSLEYCLQSLRPQDRFTLVAFNSTVNPFSVTLVDATKERIGEAVAFLRAVPAAGGTNIAEALATALRALPGSARPAFVVFLTDGLPTVGEQDPAAIVKGVEAANAARARVFTFGVGYDVNTHLLDGIAERTRAVSDYVRPKEDVEVKVSSFFAKVGAPVLTDLAFEFAGARVYDLFPRQLPDLFQGSQLLLFGRYAPAVTSAAAGSAGAVAGATSTSAGAIRLRGRVEGASREFVTDAAFPRSRGGDEALPRLWAARKIGFLLDEIRLHGKAKELVDEVIALSRQHGIVTEYTSFLIQEDGVASADTLRGTAERNFSDAFGQQTGGWAVAQSINGRNYQEQSCTGNMNWVLQADGHVRRIGGVRRIAGRTFYLRSGAWVDAAVRADLPVSEVASFSQTYFDLNHEDADVARIQSLGQEVLYVKDGRVVHCK